MQNLLKTIGFSLAVILVVWIGVTVVSDSPFRPDPKILEFGNEFSGTIKIPQSEIDTVFDSARKKMSVVNYRAGIYSLGSSVVDWIGFALTSAITLMAGFRNKPSDEPSDESNEGQAENENLGNNGPNDSRRGHDNGGHDNRNAGEPSAGRASRKIPRNFFVSIVGFLAALASVCTACSSRLDASASAEFKKVDAFQLVLRTAREQLTEETTTANASQDILDEIRIKTERL